MDNEKVEAMENQNKKAIGSVLGNIPAAAVVIPETEDPKPPLRARPERPGATAVPATNAA